MYPYSIPGPHCLLYDVCLDKKCVILEAVVWHLTADLLSRVHTGPHASYGGLLDTLELLRVIIQVRHGSYKYLVRPYMCLITVRCYVYKFLHQHLAHNRVPGSRMKLACLCKCSSLYACSKVAQHQIRFARYHTQVIDVHIKLRALETLTAGRVCLPCLWGLQSLHVELQALL